MTGYVATSTVCGILANIAVYSLGVHRYWYFTTLSGKYELFANTTSQWEVSNFYWAPGQELVGEPRPPVIVGSIGTHYAEYCEKWPKKILNFSG